MGREVAGAGHVRIEPDTNVKLKALSKFNRRSVQAEGEIAIDQHLKRHSSDVKKALAQFPEGE